MVEVVLEHVFEDTGEIHQFLKDTLAKRKTECEKDTSERRKKKMWETYTSEKENTM